MGFADIFQDPETVKLMNDPHVMAAVKDVMLNPQNMAKYKNDPQVVKLLEKLMAATGGPPPDMPPKPVLESFSSLLLFN